MPRLQSTVRMLMTFFYVLAGAACMLCFFMLHINFEANVRDNLWCGPIPAPYTLHPTPYTLHPTPYTHTVYSKPHAPYSTP
jgi:hypothetical protein